MAVLGGILRGHLVAFDGTSGEYREHSVNVSIACYGKKSLYGSCAGLYEGLYVCFADFSQESCTEGCTGGSTDGYANFKIDVNLSKTISPGSELPTAPRGLRPARPAWQRTVTQQDYKGGGTLRK